MSVAPTETFEALIARRAKATKVSKTWTPDLRTGILAQLESAKAREDLLKRYHGPADIARAVDPNFVYTPAIAKIDRAIEAVFNAPPGKTRNLLVTMPPQEGKSTMCAVYTPLRMLQRNPNMRCVLATYAQGLAETHSTTARNIVKSYGSGLTDALTGASVDDLLGFQLARGANKVSNWSIEGSDGGMVAVGMGGTITGRRADLFIIDDPYKDMQEADSATRRAKVDLWFANVVTSRLSPGAPIILIQTRWHPEDLAGTVLAAEKELPKAERSWMHINIPAISEAGIKDALAETRTRPGIPMISARDTETERRDFPATRKKVGERVWYAMYQGNPTNPAGGLFLRKWFEGRRVDATPTLPLLSIVAIDPADSGEGDETGIIAGCVDSLTGKAVLTEDWSGQMTSDEWGKQAVTLALKTGAREIALESYTTATTYEHVLKRAWDATHKAAVDKHNSGGILTPIETRALAPNMPFTIYRWRIQGDDVARSALLRQACETGECITVEPNLDTFINQACDWQAGQHQPDRVAAAVICQHRIAALGTGRTTLAAPVNTRPGNNVPAWLRRRITDK